MTPRRLSGPAHTLLLRGLARALLLLALAVPGAAQDALAEAREFFARHCAACHGPQGRGDGPVAPLLRPPPRDFGLGQFRIVSTSNLVPSDDDLRDTLKLGLPGSAMPGWSHLPPEQLDGLVQLVREFAVASAAARRGPDESPEQAHERARHELEPGPPPALGAPPPPDEALAARGAVLYAEQCARCHAADGSGQVEPPLVDALGRPAGARDFRSGLLRGGADPLQLALRIRLGMPGSAMPAFELPADDLWAVVQYVQSLIPDEPPTRLLPVRQELLALSVPEGSAAAPLDARRRGQPIEVPGQPKFLTLLPMDVSADLPEGLDVVAWHDGQQLGLLVRWPREASDDEGLLQLDCDLSDEPEPTLFAAREAPGVRLTWSWMADTRAADFSPEEAGAPPSGNPLGVELTGSRGSEHWQVLFTGPPNAGGLPLRADETLRIMFRLRIDGRRAFTVWHELHLGS